MKLIEIVKYISENPGSAFFYTPPIYESSNCYYFKKSDTSIKIFTVNEIEKQLNEIDDLLSQGLTAFGFIEYEFGYFLEDRLQKKINLTNKPLLNFFFTEESSIQKIDSNELNYEHCSSFIGKNTINDFKLDTTKEEYLENVIKIKKYIQEGDTYQVNYTVKSRFKVTSSVVELFLQLIFTQSAKYSAIINLGEKIIISSSPELFFEVDNDSIIVKPMKGTIKRGVNLKQDSQHIEELFSSGKDRAENIMIVDLLRNDIGKICEYDSVEVINKYHIEKYESVYQLTSEIKGKLKTNKLSDIIKNLFPSGSITGAPKLRTMEIIHELEKVQRGIYTGLIGIFNKQRSIANVAIRTIEIDNQSNFGQLGIGSGIVWDSQPENEFEEVLLKSKFLTEPAKYFELLETMLYENGEIFLLYYHLKRINEASNYFLFLFDESALKNELFNSIESLDKSASYKIRLTLSKWGSINLRIEEIQKETGNIDIIISDEKINSKDKYQYFKTTNREFYDAELSKAKDKGFFEVVFFNQNQYLAEGAITNIFIENNNTFYTPKIGEGILNGCYRQYILDNYNRKTEPKNNFTQANNGLYILNNIHQKDFPVEEKEITFEELINSERIILVNSVRKDLLVNKVFDSKGNLIRKFN